MSSFAGKLAGELQGLLTQSTGEWKISGLRRSADTKRPRTSLKEMKNERGSSPLDIADERPEDLCFWNGYDEIWGMNAGVAGAIRRAGSATWAVGAMLFGLLRELVADAPDSSGLTDRQLHDSDLIGEYNHRTGRLDAGNDPYGWYDEE